MVEGGVIKSIQINEALNLTIIIIVFIFII
jgi:hypothetical protein